MPDSILLPLVFGGVVAAAFAVRAFLIEPTQVEITRQDLPVPDLPPEWEGARVVHLSDLHYGDPRSERLFRWMVRTVNDLEPDLVVVTGDFICSSDREVAPCARHLAEIRARRGVIGVYGDHDFQKRPPRVLPHTSTAFEQAGVRILRNQSVTLPGGLIVAGVEPTTRKVWNADLAAALAGVNGRLPHLLLAHSPDIIPAASEKGVPLVLCGHTHGGQVVAPYYGPLKTHTRVHRRYASGWSSSAGTRIYTNRGLASHYSLRFLCPPEIAVFTLVRV